MQEVHLIPQWITQKYVEHWKVVIGWRGQQCAVLKCKYYWVHHTMHFFFSFFFFHWTESLPHDYQSNCLQKMVCSCVEPSKSAQSHSLSPRVFWSAPKDTWVLERDCWLFKSSVSWCWPKDTWALGTRQLIIQELCVLVLTKRHVGPGYEIEMCFGPQIICSWVIVTTLSGEKWQIASLRYWRVILKSDNELGDWTIKQFLNSIFAPPPPPKKKKKSWFFNVSKIIYLP